jgi:hypothetical protein
MMSIVLVNDCFSSRRQRRKSPAGYNILQYRRFAGLDAHRLAV